MFKKIFSKSKINTVTKNTDTESDEYKVNGIKQDELGRLLINGLPEQAKKELYAIVDKIYPTTYFYKDISDTRFDVVNYLNSDTYPNMALKTWMVENPHITEFYGRYISYSGIPIMTKVLVDKKIKTIIDKEKGKSSESVLDSNNHLFEGLPENLILIRRLVKVGYSTICLFVFKDIRGGWDIARGHETSSIYLVNKEDIKTAPDWVKNFYESSDYYVVPMENNGNYQLYAYQEGIIDSRGDINYYWTASWGAKNLEVLPRQYYVNKEQLDSAPYWVKGSTPVKVTQYRK